MRATSTQATFVGDRERQRAFASAIRAERRWDWDRPTPEELADFKAPWINPDHSQELDLKALHGAWEKSA